VELGGPQGANGTDARYASKTDGSSYGCLRTSGNLQDRAPPRAEAATGGAWSERRRTRSGSPGPGRQCIAPGPAREHLAGR